MYGKIRADNFFYTTLASEINATDKVGTFELTSKTVNGYTVEDGSYMFWMIVGLNDPATAEVFRITNVAGTVLTYDKRISPTGMAIHAIGSLANMQASSDFINWLSNNTNDLGYTETVDGTGNELKVKTYGGRIENPSAADIVVSDTTLTLTPSATYYVYFNDSDNTIKSSITEPETYKVFAKVVTGASAVTSIEDYRAEKIIMGAVPLSLTAADIASLANVRNGTVVYNETTGENQQYIGGDWFPIAAGSTQPRATETTEGKVRIATDVEYAAGTEVGPSGETLVPTPAQTGVSATKTTKGIARLATSAEALAGIDDTTIVTPADLKAVTDTNLPSSFIITSDYPLGEPITDITKSCVFKETAPTFAQATQAQNIGDVAGNTRVSFPAIGTGVAGNSLKLSLAKNGSPSAFLRVRIETDNAGNPSGTLVDSNATKDIDPATLTTSLADTTVLMGATTANAHGVTLNVNETSQTVYKGVKFTLTQQVGAVSVDKVAGCTATKAYLYDLAGNLLTSATFSTNTATLNYNRLVNGQSYYIMAGSDGSSYTSVKQTGASAYPYTAGRLNYVGGKGLVNNITDTLQTTTNYLNNVTNQGGCKIQANKNIYLQSISIYNGDTSTRIQIKDISLNVLYTGNIVGGVCVLSTPLYLSAGTQVVVYADANGSQYREYYSYSVNETKTNISVISGAYGANINDTTRYSISGFITTDEFPLDDTNIYNITSISTIDTILIPSGQKVHTVVSAVGDVVNASNYYKIGYSTNNTSTRPLNKWNTTRGTATSTIFPYISSTLFHNTVLSLTDSDFAYKVDLYGIATALGAAGSYPKVIVSGICQNFTGMNDGSNEYLGTTPGGIQETAGTYSYVVGQANGTNKLNITKSYWAITASDNILSSAPTEHWTSATAYSEVKRFQANETGTYRISCKIRVNNTSNSTYINIYKNFIAVGTEQSSNSVSYVTKTFDVALVKGDIISIYYKATNASYASFIAEANFCGTRTLVQNTPIPAISVID